MTKGSPTCFYSGYSYRNPEEVNIYRQVYSHNATLTKEQRAQSRKFALVARYLR